VAHLSGGLARLHVMGIDAVRIPARSLETPVRGERAARELVSVLVGRSPFEGPVPIRIRAALPRPADLGVVDAYVPPEAPLALVAAD
jgi:hypothetical protein